MEAAEVTACYLLYIYIASFKVRKKKAKKTGTIKEKETNRQTEKQSTQINANLWSYVKKLYTWS